MRSKRLIEVFSAGCPACDDAVQIINEIACPSCDVQILNMHQPEVAAKGAQYAIRNVPAVVIDGKVADCCAGRGIDESSLRAAGVGLPLP